MAMSCISLSSGSPTFMQPVGMVRFELTNETLEKIRQFQMMHPDVTIKECSYYINKAIINAMEEYELNCQQQ